jgi:hypothetical protein
MIDPITPFVRLLLHYRVRAIRRYEKEGDTIQRRTLEMLIKEARNTQWGKEHGYPRIHSYEDYVARVPMGDYASHKPYIAKMMEGTPDVLWKGRITRFATSSGTTSDVSKFIPVSKRALRRSHLRGGRDVTATYLDQNRNSHAGMGYSMILSGQFDPEYDGKKIKVGFISAIMSEAVPSFYRKLIHIVPSSEITHMEDVHAMLEAVSGQIAQKNLITFSGVPSWNLMVLEKAVKMAGVKNAEQLWPNMELFAHGGMSLLPYRQKISELFPSGRLHFIENYNASEGFFGVQTDLSDPAMTLMLDYEVFYEFVPMSSYGKPEARAVPVWELETGVDYAVLVSTSSGLWRYDMGDVVRFTKLRPYRFVIVGRTHQNISVAGEDLSVQQAEKALDLACGQLGASVKEFTVAPVLCPEHPSDGHHQWLIEFEKEPENLEEFAALLDQMVRAQDLDYKEARGCSELGALELVPARPGLFYDWLDAKGKLGGQFKIPRLSRSREHIEELLNLNSR